MGDADKDSGLEDALESEKKAKDPVELKTGGIRSTDPAFADGAMEVDSKSNQPHPDKDEK